MRNPIQKRSKPARSPRGWLAALGAGAGAMYLLDPVSGSRRRAMVRDKTNHYLRKGNAGLRKARVDLMHRAEGLAAEVTRRFDNEPVVDEILVQRVRARMGLVVSHPGAVEVGVQDGVVNLSGPILAREAPRLLRKAATTPGVVGVLDALERHESSEGIPALQAGRRREDVPSFLQENWPPGIRLLAGGGGALLLAYGRLARGPFASLMGLGGAGLLLRAATNFSFHRMAGVGAGYRVVDVHKDIHIQAPVEEVYGFFEDVANLPRFMSHLYEVQPRGDGRSHWVAAGPGGLRVHWDAEVTRREPNEVLAWRSLPDSQVKSAGVVRFAPIEGGTHVEVRLSYNPPAGALGHAVAALFGADPKRALDDDLLRLKSLLETGRARAHGEQVSRDQLV